ncbi:hypothetical protein J3E69DRAFT_320421 [Trichoderma sp. SZMC 28015]
MATSKFRFKPVAVIVEFSVIGALNLRPCSCSHSHSLNLFFFSRLLRLLPIIEYAIFFFGLSALMRRLYSGLFRSGKVSPPRLLNRGGL